MTFLDERFVFLVVHNGIEDVRRMSPHLRGRFSIQKVLWSFNSGKEHGDVLKSSYFSVFLEQNNLNMYDILKHSHSGLRWVVLILLLAAIFQAFGAQKSGVYEKRHKMVNLFAMISVHIQVTLGIIMAFLSPKISYTSIGDESWMKNPMFRFFGMEHILMMVIAMILITIGRKKAEKKADAAAKHKAIAVWYTIVLIVILAGIPWPFRNLGAGWF